MKAILFDTFGDEGVLRLGEAPKPELRPDDLLVRVAATGVNRADLLQRTGAYGRPNFGDSDVMGLEIAGTVVEVGERVEGFAHGDRVMGIVGGGAYAEFARIDHRSAVRIPDHVSFVDAAAIMESFVTACEAVTHLADVKPGQSILVHAAAGGVGSACVQLASALGATVYATASTALVDRVKTIGAAHVVDYRHGDFDADILALTGGAGVDAVIDFIGGDYLARNLRLLKPGGVLVQVGLMSGQAETTMPLNLVLHNHLRIIGTVMKSRTAQEKRAMTTRFVERVLPLFAASRLHPLISATYQLADAAQAHRRMKEGGGFGKIVLIVDPSVVSNPPSPYQSETTP
ncbi:NAD(P)H-quinone oxidoreductase [Tardiphaga sp. 42S5]|uniref:NAD(P)H-quinone oxidoreductase n=1 Tax=Tardiphaga sp. 42S5 TaxID=1404799 RepID=UPI002A59E452|nr:NAD(P)H-quinone oxidoreductase [Tardiphaga sp. 42S5]WPO40321.1 NAD(P)H-quinone oxidoreductase [Tardiphaga sp. 42S5]